MSRSTGGVYLCSLEARRGGERGKVEGERRIDGGSDGILGRGSDDQGVVEEEGHIGRTEWTNERLEAVAGRTGSRAGAGDCGSG